MITNLIRKALGPEIENRLNGESIRLNAIINELENALDDVKSIRASDIADNISTYDIAADISIDTYELARNIEIDATDIEIDYAALARHLGDNIEIDVSDIEVDTRDLAERIAGEIGDNIVSTMNLRLISDTISLNEVNANINNVRNELSALGLKIHEIYAFIRNSTGKDMIDSENEMNGGGTTT